VRSGELIERELSAATLQSESAAFPHAAQAICARRKTTHKKTGKETSGTRRFITSLSAAEAPPPRLAMLVRGHWSVENNIHWLRDAVWNEDACRTHVPNTACVLALLRTTLLAPPAPGRPPQPPASHRKLRPQTPPRPPPHPPPTPRLNGETLLCTPEGLPLSFEVFAGNRTDVATVEEIMELTARTVARPDRHVANCSRAWAWNCPAATGSSPPAPSPPPGQAPPRTRKCSAEKCRPPRGCLSKRRTGLNELRNLG